MTEDLTSIDGVGPAIADQLREAGFETAVDVHDADVDELADVHLLGEASAREILDEGEGSSRGREFAIDADDHDEILGAASMGKSVRGCARAAGVSLSQLQRYLEAHDDFRVSFERARARGESQLIEGGLRDPDMDSSFAKFLLASSFEYKKTEKKEVENTGDEPLTNVVIDFEDVDT